MLTVGSAQAVGYVAALVTLVAPAGLGIRDAAFAWAVKGAVPGNSFAVGSLIAIAVRGVLTVVEVLYVGLVTALGKREGWSIPTGVMHPSPEEAGGGPAGPQRDADSHARDSLAAARRREVGPGPDSLAALAHDVGAASRPGSLAGAPLREAPPLQPGPAPARAGMRAGSW